jgi:hypothetical protein
MPTVPNLFAMCPAICPLGAGVSGAVLFVPGVNREQRTEAVAAVATAAARHIRPTHHTSHVTRHTSHAVPCASSERYVSVPRPVADRRHLDWPSPPIRHSLGWDEYQTGRQACVLGCPPKDARVSVAFYNATFNA